MPPKLRSRLDAASAGCRAEARQYPQSDIMRAASVSWASGCGVTWVLLRGNLCAVVCQLGRRAILRRFGGAVLCTYRGREEGGFSQALFCCGVACGWNKAIGRGSCSNASFRFLAVFDGCKGCTARDWQMIKFKHTPILNLLTSRRHSRLNNSQLALFYT